MAAISGGRGLSPEGTFFTPVFSTSTKALNTVLVSERMAANPLRTVQ